VLLWDVVQARLGALWRELGAAGDPMPQLPADRPRTVGLLKERLSWLAGADKRARALLADLDNDAFDVREKATKELQKLGPLAEPALREALKGSPTAEARRRIRQVLDGLGGRPAGEPDSGGCLKRGVKLLEDLDTAEARQALRELSRGDPHLPLTPLAREALERLDRSDRPR
jgi:hypothetical protein